MDDGYYDEDVSGVIDVATTTFGKTRRITVEGDELKRKCDAMADECFARNKKGIACEEERKRCKRRVSPRWFNGATFHERLDHFLFTADERVKRAERAKRADRAHRAHEASEEKRRAGEAKKEAVQWASALRRAREERPERPGRTERPDEKSIEDKRVLRMLKLFLTRTGASMGTIDVKLLSELERDFMPTVRARVPSARLIGVPAGLGDEWSTYVYLYCLYLVAVGALGADGAVGAHGAVGKDTTLFVSVPGPSSGPHGPSSGPSGLRVCSLRFDAEGRVRLSY